MRIVIAGAGDVGFHVTKLLSYENQDIGVIDISSKKLAYVSSHLDVATIQGSSTSHAVLTEARVTKADLVIAVTSSEEINLTTCILANYLGADGALYGVHYPDRLWPMLSFATPEWIGGRIAAASQAIRKMAR